MFLGRFAHTVDNKGRVSIPTRFREILGDLYEDKLIITPDPDRCLSGYPFEEWQRIQEKVKNLPRMNQSVKDWLRFFYAGASETGLDRQGRILLTAFHRSFAHISRDVVIIGLDRKIEIWDASRWKERENRVPENAEKIGEELSDLGL